MSRPVKPAIDTPAGVKDPKVAKVLREIKQNLDVITGDIGGSLQSLPSAALPSTATLLDTIGRVNALNVAVNEIIAKLNRSN